MYSLINVNSVVCNCEHTRHPNCARVSYPPRPCARHPWPSRMRGESLHKRRHSLFSVYLRKIPAHILVAVFLVPWVSAQEMTALPVRLIIPDRTPIKLQLAESVSSAH